MDKLILQAKERQVLGKQVKKIRKAGQIPAHVFGKNIPTDHISVEGRQFLAVYKQAGESGLIDLMMAEKKAKPVLIRNVQVNPVNGRFLHIDFYQVNLSEKVSVPVPVVLTGEEPELVRSGEAVVIQPLSEVQVEALPTEIPEKIEADKSSLKKIGDTVLVSQLQINLPVAVTILTDPEAVVVKLDTAVTEEMKKLMEEQATEAAAVAAAQTEAKAELAEAGETTEGETPAPADSASIATSAKETAAAGEPAEGGKIETKEGEEENK